MDTIKDLYYVAVLIGTFAVIILVCIIGDAISSYNRMVRVISSTEQKIVTLDFKTFKAWYIAAPAQFEISYSLNSVIISSAPSFDVYFMFSRMSYFRVRHWIKSGNYMLESKAATSEEYEKIASGIIDAIERRRNQKGD